MIRRNNRGKKAEKIDVSQVPAGGSGTPRGAADALQMTAAHGRSAEMSMTGAASRPSQVKGQKQGLLRGFSSLSYLDYRLLWIGQLGWSGAMWMDNIARNWLVWQITGSGLNLGLINMARALPQLILALPAGVVADRFNKKRVLQISQLATFACYLSMLALVWTGSIQLWHIYLLSALLGTSMSLNQPSRQSLLPRLVPREALLNAIALNQVAMNTTRVVGPALSGLLIGFLGVTWAYGVATFVFLTVVVCTFLIKTAEGQSTARKQSPSAQVMEGLKYVVHDKSILAVLAVALIAFTFVMPYTTLMPIVADQVFGIGAKGYGLLLSLAGVGALLGGLLMATFGQERRTSLLFMGGAFAFGSFIVFLGIVPWIWLAFLAMPLIGASQSLFMAAGNTALLSRTPTELHGRVMSVYALDHGLQPLGSALAGSLADGLSSQSSLVIMGGIGMALVVAIGTIIPSVRKL